MAEMVYTWKGQIVRDMAREELIEAMEEVCQHHFERIEEKKGGTHGFLTWK
jgi:hypothetical protein